MKKQYLLFLILMTALLPLAQAQNSPCPGLKNPTSFTSGSTSGTYAGYYSGQTGTNINQAPDALTGTTGVSMTSAVIPAAQLANTTDNGSSSYCSSTLDPSHQFRIMSTTDGPGTDGQQGHDPLVNYALPYTPSAINPEIVRSIRLGNCQISNHAEALYYTLNVNPQNALLFIYYSIVVQAPGHGPTGDPSFVIRITRETSYGSGTWQQISDTHFYSQNSSGQTDGVNGWNYGLVGSTYGFYRNWDMLPIDLSDYLFETIRIEFYISDCTASGHYGYCYIAGDCHAVDFDPTYCPPVYNLTATNTSFDNISLAWSEQGSATGWQVEFGQSGFERGSGMVDTTYSTEYTATGLTPQTAYDFYITPVCAGDTSFTQMATFITDSTCFPVSELTLEESSTTSLSLSWTELGVATQWLVEYDGAGFTPGEGIMDTAYSTEYTATGLTPQTAYDFYITPVCNGDALTEMATFITDSTCFPVSNITLEESSTTRLSLSWTEQGTATSWQVEYGESGFTRGEGIVDTAYSTGFTATGLMSHTAYDFYISPICLEVSISAEFATFETECSPNDPALGCYTYSTGLDQTKWIIISDSTNLLGTGNADGRASSLYNIGFTFPFAESYFTQFSVNSDGNLRLGSTVTGIASYSTPFSSANSNNNSPKINFFGCDGYFLDSIHYVFAENTVDVNNDSLLVVEYRLGTYNSTTRTQKYNWQVHLYPNGNITVVYAATAPSANPNASHQQGLCVDASDGLIIDSHDNAAHFTSGSSTNWPSSTWPAPNTYYNFTRPSISCPYPVHLGHTQLTHNACSISWQDTNGATEWIVNLHADGFDTTLSVNNTTYTFTSLTPNTEYSVTVASVCSNGDTSFCRQHAFHTLCSPMTSLPYTEDFESAATGSSTNPSFVECWRRLNNGTLYFGYPYVSSNNTYYNHTPDGGQGLNWYNNTTTGTYGDYQCVVLPAVDTSIYPMGTLQLRFWARASSTSYNPVFQVGVMTDPTDINNFEPVDTIEVGNSTVWQEFVTYFADYSGQGTFVAVKAERPISSWYAYVDDFTLAVSNSCPTPANLKITALTTESATLQWSRTGDETAWIVSNSTEEAMVTDTTYTFQTLTPNTSYLFTIRAICSGGDTTLERVAYETTLCTPITSLPYTEDFESAATGGSSNPNFVECWRRLNNGTTYFGYPYVNSNNTYNHTPDGGQGLYWYNNTTTGTYGDYQCVVLPAVDTSIYPMGTLQLRFWARASSTSYNPVFQVGVMTDPTVINSFEPVATIEVGNSTVWQEFVTYFADYSGQGTFVAVKAERPTSSWYAYVDDFTLAVSNSCPQGTREVVQAEGAYAWCEQTYYESGIYTCQSYTADGCLVTDTLELTIWPNCFTHLTDSAGTFDDGSGDGNYQDNTDCWWLIQPQGAKTVELSFTEFYTEYCCDAVWVHDGVNPEAPIIAEFRGDGGGGNVHSTGNSLLVHFTTDGSVTSSGWTAHYTGSDCYCSQHITYNMLDGSFSDNSGVNDYLNNSNCSWLIRPSEFNGAYPDSITLTFTNFNTEEDYDVVTVYDGDSTDAPILATLSGNYDSVAVTSTGGNMLVVFTTNDSITASGWDASYYSHVNLDFFVYSENEEMGIVSGSGSHPRDSEFTIEAFPNDGYIFWHWSDGSPENPRTMWSSNYWNGSEFWAYFRPVRETDVPANVPTDGLMAYYPFSNNADDYSGNNNHGIPLWGWSSPNPTTDRFGIDNSAYWFSGYCDQRGIRVTHNSSLDLDTAFAASFWVLQESGCNWYGDNKYGNIICRDGDWEGLCINLGDEYDNGQPDVQRLEFFNRNHNEWGETQTNFNLNSYMNCHGTPIWTHYVAMVDGRHVSIYCNGVLVADTINEQSASFGSANERDLMIGIYGDEYSLPFNGAIDDIALYNRALSLEEIQSLYGGYIDSTEVCVSDTINSFSGIIWHGNTYTESGDYVIRTANGCDTVFRLHLSIHDGCTIQSLPYFDNFDYYTTSTTAKTGVRPPCWTLARQDVAIADEYKPMIYYNAENSHSGDYSLILNKRGIFTMPYLDANISDIKMSFYLKQQQTKYRLQVGVMSDLWDFSTYVPVTTINNSSTDIEFVRVDFSSYTGNGHYIAFRNILPAGNNGDYSINYIDDLTLYTCPTGTYYDTQVLGSYTWHDSTYSASGLYTYDYVDRYGCPITDTLHLTVCPALSGTAQYSDATVFAQGLNVPHYMCFDTLGNLYVVNHYGNNITRIDTSGSISIIGGGLYYPTGIAIDKSQALFVSTHMTNTITKIPYGENQYNWSANIFSQTLVLFDDSNPDHFRLYTGSGGDLRMTDYYGRSSSIGNFNNIRWILGLSEDGKQLYFNTSNDGKKNSCLYRYSFAENSSTRMFDYTISGNGNYGSIGPDNKLYFIGNSMTNPDYKSVYRLDGVDEVTEIVTGIPVNTEVYTPQWKQNGDTYDLYLCEVVNGDRGNPDYNRIIKFASLGNYYDWKDTMNVTVCGETEYTWPVNGMTYTENGSYYYHTQTPDGCDSMVILNLIFGGNDYVLESVMEVNAYTWHDSTYTESGIYTYSREDEHGCTATDTLNLIICPQGINDIVNAIDYYEWHGQTYYENGWYTYDYYNDEGCYITDTLQLYLWPCYTHLTDSEGTFSYGPEDPDADCWVENYNCAWLIEPEGATTVELTILKEHEDWWDHIIIYDGNTTDAPVIGWFQDWDLPRTVISTGNSMLVRVENDDNCTGSKWTAHYKGRDCYCPSQSILTDVDGWFYDNSVDDYANNSNCSWLIRPYDFNGAYPDSITLTFTNFNTEEDYDFITVYDGDSTNAPILATLSGNYDSVAVTSTGGNMLVVFTTNDSINASGWEASYYSHVNLDFFVYSENEEMGTVSGSGSHPRDSEFTIEAFPNEGYVFWHWSDGSTENPRTMWSSGWWNGEEHWAYFLPVRETDIPDNVPEDGLIAYYPFENNAEDYSGNNNHGTPLWGWNSPDPTTDRFGIDNNAYWFSGYCDQRGIRVTHNSSLDLDTAFAASFWVLQESGCNWYGDNKYGNIICRDGDWEGLCINLGDEYDNGQPDVQRLEFFNKNHNEWGETQTNFNLNSYMNCHGTPIWTHYVAMVDGRHVSIYCNGVLVADTINEQSASFGSANDRDLMIGIMGDNYSWPFYGKLDDIALYNRALSHEEIQSLYGGYIDSTEVCVSDTITALGSIVWHGNTYTESGDYVIRTANGCDTIYRLHLNILYECAILPDNLPYTDNFDSYTVSTTAKTFVEPPCWTLVRQDVAMADEYKPMIYYSANNANSGNYSLILNKRGIYAMPAYEGDVSSLLLSFHLRQQMSKYQLQVGVMSNLDDYTTFVPVATINNSSTDIEYVEVDLSSYTGEGHYIAFRNILASGNKGDFSCNYIDDITLSLLPFRCGISANKLPYTENFDAYTSSTTAKTGTEPPCWTLAHQDVPMTDAYKPMIYYGTAYSHSGDYSLILNKRGIYAMPEFDGDVTTLQMSLYVRQPQTKFRLQVGVMSDLNDANTFVPVTTINNSSTSAPVRHTVNFTSYTGTGHYIAFRNILPANTGGEFSCNYLDDITLTIAEVYTVTATSNPVAGGTVTGTGNYVKGSTCTLTATPNDNYTFTGWTIGNNVVSTNPTYSFTVTNNRNLQANFEYSINCGILIADLPYTDNFDSYTTASIAKTGVEPTCWTLAYQEVPMADEYKPMIYYNAANAHSGNYSLILNKRGIYAMPAFEGEVNTLQVSFYLKQNLTKYRLQVGVMSDVNDYTTFVPVTTIDNSTTGVEHVTVNLSTYTGNGHYIAFRNTLASGYTGDFSCNYIDDLTLELSSNNCGIGIDDLPYFNNFDTYTTSTTAKTGVAPDCWTLVHQDVTMTDEYKPMIYYKASNAHSGNYSLILNKRGIYAMPAYEGDVNTLQLSFYLCQQAIRYQLIVGILSDPGDASTFAPIDTINNSTTGVEYVEIDFSSYSGSGHYIAFRNILAPGSSGDYSCNYIDDLTLSLAGAKGGISDDSYDMRAPAHSLTLYPNPTTGKLTVEADEKVERVDVFDYTGRCVATFERQTTIDLSRLATGLYTLRVTLPERIEVRRVVKQ